MHVKGLADEKCLIVRHRARRLISIWPAANCPSPHARSPAADAVASRTYAFLAENARFAEISSDTYVNNKKTIKSSNHHMRNAKRPVRPRFSRCVQRRLWVGLFWNLATGLVLSQLTRPYRRPQPILQGILSSPGPRARINMVTRHRQYPPEFPVTRPSALAVRCNLGEPANPVP